MSDAAQGRGRQGFAAAADIDLFLEKLTAFERGELSADAWRAFRLVNGTYPQRQEGDLSMLRVKIPQGVLTAVQLETFAEAVDRHARGFGHFTTRQNLQLHFVHLPEVEPAMRLLAEAGLTCREACGNSVRNVTACALAGVAEDEVFDPTPYGEAVTRYLLRHPLSAVLPRKFKIAFEGCPEDHAFAAIHDLGFRARLRTEGGRTARGFRVLAGGGTSTVPVSARVLVDFLPAGDLLAICEAVVRVYHRLGDYQHRQRNRLKFLVRQLGWEGFQREVETELAAVRASGVPPLPFDPERPPEEGPPAWARPAPPAPAEVAALVARTPPRGPGVVPEAGPSDAGPAAFAAWRGSNVRAQRQPGFVTAAVTLPIGDVTGGQLRALAALARAFGDGEARVTQTQGLLLRWVREGDLLALFERLAAAGLGADGAGTLADVVSCPGTETCRLAVTSSRGAARLLGEHLRANPQLTAAAPDLSIKVSGCPNGCSQHHIAGLGLQGSLRKVGGRAVPQYFVLLGGGVGDEGARFGRLAAKIPARRLPQAVERLLALYLAERAEGETASAFFARVPVERAKAALAEVEALPAEAAAPDDFEDLVEAAPSVA
jgi:sulfite reductase beta subunit-like hemoprotein